MRTPEEMLESLEATAAQLQEKANEAESLFAESTTTVTSTDKSVTVTVNAGGVLTGLECNSHIRSMTPTSVAKVTLDAYRQAVEESGRKTTEIMSGLFGGDSEALDIMQSFTRPVEEV